MRRQPLAWTLALLLAGLAASASTSRAGPGEEPLIPPPSGPVVDLAGVLPEGARAELVELARTVERQTGAELAVLALSSTEPLTIQEYSVRVFERWRIGKRGQDNGLLLVVAPGDRRVWITTGYGLEGILPDSLVGEVRDQVILPAFRQGEYARGIVAGMRALAEVVLKEGKGGPRAQASPTPARRPGLRLWGGSIPLLVLLGGLVLVLLLLQRRQAGLRRGRDQRLVRDDAGAFPPFLVLPGGAGGFWGGAGGWSGGGFGAGDFSGFGGGDTGGGGAGGEW